MVTLTITLATTAVAVASMSAIQATPNNGGGPCHTDADCHLAGKCAVHVCDCSPEWLGNHCELLALLPAKLDSGFRPPAASSWGGKVVKGGRDDEFHLYAAMFTNHCGLQSWTHNSEVVHAVSSSPTGPYSTVPSERPILATFAHNPTVATIASTAHDDGLYVLAHIGCGEQTTTPLSTCFNGTSCTSPTNCSGVPNSNKAAGSGCDTPHWTGTCCVRACVRAYSVQRQPFLHTIACPVRTYTRAPSVSIFSSDCPPCLLCATHPRGPAHAR